MLVIICRNQRHQLQFRKAFMKLWTSSTKYLAILSHQHRWIFSICIKIQKKHGSSMIASFQPLSRSSRLSYAPRPRRLLPEPLDYPNFFNPHSLTNLVQVIKERRRCHTNSTRSTPLMVLVYVIILLWIYSQNT